jgi:metal-responsive CopG/Arc/MetJ family transcriptional regulator
MAQSQQKQRVSITVDSRLLEEVDKLTNNRSAAFEEGIRLWYAKQIEEQLRKSYESRTQADVDFEEEWATFAQEQMEDSLRAENL